MSVQIVTKTWPKDSYNLFDYESKNIQLKHMTCFAGCKVVRTDSGIKLISKKQALGGQQALLTTIDFRRGEYFVQGSELDPLWLIIRHKKRGVVLSETSVLKLGRVTLSIRKLQSSDHLGQDSNTGRCSPIEGVCKVCLTEDSEPSNPLIAPCACSGSVQAIHIDCLRRWIDSRKISGPGTVHWKSVDCEICKTKYPFSIVINDTTFDLLSFSTAPQIVFECTNKDNDSGVHVVSFAEKNEITVGRGTDSDLRISDISVSRNHATFAYKDGKFFVFDNNSKFGSLLRCNEPLKIDRQKTLHLQAGRTVLAFSGHKPERQKSVNLS